MRQHSRSASVLFFLTKNHIKLMARPEFLLLLSAQKWNKLYLFAYFSKVEGNL
jgi:hypothetical protein